MSHLLSQDTRSLSNELHTLSEGPSSSRNECNGYARNHVGQRHRGEIRQGRWATLSTSDRVGSARHSTCSPYRVSHLDRETALVAPLTTPRSAGFEPVPFKAADACVTIVMDLPRPLPNASGRVTARVDRGGEQSRSRLARTRLWIRPRRWQRPCGQEPARRGIPPESDPATPTARNSNKASPSATRPSQASSPRPPKPIEYESAKVWYSMCRRNKNGKR